MKSHEHHHHHTHAHDAVCDVDDDLCEMARWSVRHGLARDDAEANFLLVSLFVIITAVTIMLAQASFLRPDTSSERKLIEKSKGA